MANYLVNDRGGDRVMEFSDQPGTVGSTVLPPAGEVRPEGPRHPVSGFVLRPDLEADLGEHLRACESAADLRGRLERAGYSVEEVPEGPAEDEQE